MIKTNLPVIILRGIVLLPNNDIRIEFDNEINKSVIDVSELFHDSRVLVINQTDILEETVQIKELPRIGVIAKISHKIELPNGNIRIILTGIKRANVCEFLNLNRSSEILESIVSDVDIEKIDPNKEMVLIKKVIREIEIYIKNVPYISNSIMSLITNVTSLDKITDLIAPNLNIDIKRLDEYLNTLSQLKRSSMILEDIYKEQETVNIEKEIDAKVRQGMEDTQKEYLLREKMKYIKEELGDISIKENELEIIREKISNGNYPEHIVKRLNNELKRYESLSQTSPEINILRTYIEWILDLPWNKKTVDNEDLNEVLKKLDSSHYGLNDIKERIIEYLAVKKQTNNLKSPIICLVGPPGTGKTSLAFSIADAIKRNFVKMSVGGVNDESEIVGHRKTYLGANPGRIIQSLKKSGSNNPVFLIDEIDKMTKDYKGDPASCLLEILDPEQNKFFSDNYIEEQFDLSQVMFIATANYIEDIPEALKDRLEIIKLTGYTEYEKLDIVKKHLLKKVTMEHGISNNIKIDNETILKIIRSYTKEAGVRELERQIAKIIRKIVTDKIMNNKDINEFEISDLEKYLGKEKYPDFEKNNGFKIGVVNGLAYTPYGGDTLPIEVNLYKGNGSLILTGSLGEVMKESAQIALSYLKANYQLFKIDYEKFSNNIHIHVPEGAIKKDGPSAGIAITTAILSALTSTKISGYLALTGEITLRGNVLAIGGLKEKSLGAYRSGIKKIIIPYDNLNDLEEIPSEIKEKIEFIPVKKYYDVFKIIKR